MASIGRASSDVSATVARDFGVSHETRRSLENDGHRTVIGRTDDSVVLDARSGRIVTPVWMDLALAAQKTLRPGTVLDGEAVIWRNGAIDFPAVQARAASTPVRARELAAALPASYAAFDLIAHPDPSLGDVRGRPYVERRRLLLELLEDVGPPLQPVPATDDREVAMTCYQVLQLVLFLPASNGVSYWVARMGVRRTWGRPSSDHVLRPRCTDQDEGREGESAG
ncbi:hypothetical protein ACGFYF_38870 [Streptomyces lavendulae]|uniref:ATP-dependent DNA ligase n=1 Tax=Streptomyces lavendulae TaxID=1914 RepID=UPI00371D06D0